MAWLNTFHAKDKYYTVMILEPTWGGSRPKNVRSGIGRKSDRPSEGPNELNRGSDTTPVFLAHSKHKLWGD